MAIFVNTKRKPTIHEIVLLIIGIFLVIFGYIAISKMVIKEGFFSWGLLQTIFLWFLVILTIVLTAVNENMKEELKVVIGNQAEEIRLLRADLNKRR